MHFHGILESHLRIIGLGWPFLVFIVLRKTDSTLVLHRMTWMTILSTFNSRALSWSFTTAAGACYTFIRLCEYIPCFPLIVIDILMRISFSMSNSSTRVFRYHVVYLILSLVNSVGSIRLINSRDPSLYLLISLSITYERWEI